MNQDEAWCGGRPRPTPHCVRWGPSFSSQKKEQPQIFVLCLLWPNDWMDQDATWYRGRPRPRLHCVRCEPNFAPPWKLFGPYLLWPNGRPSQQLLSSCFMNYVEPSACRPVGNCLACLFLNTALCVFKHPNGCFLITYYETVQLNIIYYHNYMCTVFQKNWITKLMAVTLSNLNRFSKFFHSVINYQ